jgi:hypothetical protein
MSAVTAEILIGNPHPNDGGIRAFARIHLEEGDRPAFVLSWSRSPQNRDEDFFRKFTMIPTLENMLDDSALMVAYAVCRHSAVFDKVNRLTQGVLLDSHRLSMYDDFTPEDREKLYNAVKKLKDLPKVTWCLFDGSHLKNSIAHLVEYKLPCEVTQSVFVHEYSNWTDSWDVKGVLS